MILESIWGFVLILFCIPPVGMMILFLLFLFVGDLYNWVSKVWKKYINYVGEAIRRSMTDRDRA